MSETANHNSENDRAGPAGEASSPSRFSLVQQRGAGCHPTTGLRT